MGGQNTNAPGRNPSGNPTNKDTSVTFRAPGNPGAPPAPNVNLNGGQGKPYDPVTNPYGVKITTGRPNAYGESQDRGGGGRGIVGGPYGVIMKDSQSNDWNSKANDYSKSLVTNAGLKEGSDQYNTALNNYLTANKLERTNQQDQASKDISQPKRYDENYGYTGDVKVSPIVSQNFAKNPLETNWDLSKNRQAEQARRQSRDFFSSDQGGVKTAASEALGAKYSWKNSEKITESIGSKIFSNQPQLSRGSIKEEQVKQSEAERAFTGTSSNKDYATGGTKEPDYNSVVSVGKAQSVFGKTKSGNYGWSSISKDQLVRDSIQEKALNTTLGARNTYQEGKGTPFSGGLIDKTAQRNASDVFLSMQSQKPFVASKPQAKDQSQDFNTFFANEQAKGATIDIFNQQGAKVGSVKANEQGRQTLESLGDTQGVYFRESRPSSGYVRNNDFIDTISILGNQGATINIFNSKNQKVGSVSGPNAYRDYQQQFGKSQETLYAQPVFSTTREGKQTTESLITSARTVGATSVSVFSTEKGKPPKQIESLALNPEVIGSALDKYSGNTSISFGVAPKQIENPKDTMIPASVTPLDFAYINNKANTGKYFDLNQQVQGFLSNLNKESKLPATAPGETTNLFGIKIVNPSTTLYEAGQNFGSFVVGGVKSIPPLAAGLGTSYYNFFTKGSTGGPATKVESPRALANVLGASFLAPQTFMGEQASKNFEGTQSFIHSNIGIPLKEQGIVTPQTVQNPKTIGAFVGTVAGVGTMLAPLAKVIPVRVAGEAGTLAFPGIGRIKSAGPLAGSEPYVQGPKTITITGVTLGYGGAKTVMLYGKSSEGKSFILSKLSPKFNPETGKENLHLETYYSSAERGSPFPESTKLTLSKLANEKTGQVFAQIKNEQGISKFSESEFGLELKAKEANKYYNKIPNQKVSEAKANEFFKQTSIIPENPEVIIQVKQIAQGLQSRSSASKNAVASILTGNTKLASSYGTFGVSPLQPAKGSPIVVGQLTEFNAKQERANLIGQPKAESVKDIDIELTRERQSESLLNILNAKVERPEGYEFSKQGTNIYYGLAGEKGKEVFNLLGDKDVNPTDLSTSSGSGVFGKAYPTKTAKLGEFKTKTIGYQARALTNSLSATHNLEIMEKTKEGTEPTVFAGIQGRLSKSEHIVTAFTPRLTKDLSRNVAVLEYGIKTAKSGKAREAFTEYRNALLEKHPYVELENVSPNELSKQLDIAKSASKAKESESILSNKSNAAFGSIHASQFASTPSRFPSSKSVVSSRSSFESESSRTSPSSAKSSKSAKSSSSILSTKSVNSILSPKSSKSPTSSKSSKSVGSTRSVLSPKSTSSYSVFSPTSPNSPSSPTYPKSSSSRTIYPISTSSPSLFSPNSPLYQSPTNPSIFLPKLGASVGRKRKNKTKSGPTALLALRVTNIFAPSFNINPKRRYSF